MHCPTFTHPTLLADAFKSARSFAAATLAVAAVFAVSGVTSVYAGTHTPIPKGQNETPFGYMEFLPDNYSSTTDKLPLVVFFHGIGEGGTGSTSDLLNKVTRHGPPLILQNPTHLSFKPSYDVINGQRAIVLSPQYPADSLGKAKWTGIAIRDFFNYLFTKSRYSPRIDMSRIYLTGLSGGSIGIYDYMNTQPQANRKTALLVTAPVEAMLDAYGMGAGAYTAFWAFSSNQNSSGSATTAADRIANYINGNGPGGIMANYKVTDSNGNLVNPSYDRTALYSASTRWFWVNGIDYTTAYHPKVTLYPSTAHDSWTRTYNNHNVWTWLFSQKKVVAETTSPTLSITQPTTASTYTTTALTLNLAGTASDNVAVHRLAYQNNYTNPADGKPAIKVGVITGNVNNWTKTGLELFPGLNKITITARDTSGNPVSKILTVTRN